MFETTDREGGAGESSGSRPAPAGGMFGGRSSLLRNVATNWISLAFTLAYSFIITPISVHALNQRLYGAWSFMNGLLAYSDLLYLGLGTVLVQTVGEFAATGQRHRLNRVASVVLSVYLAAGLTTFILSAALAPNLSNLFAEPLAASESRQAALSCLLLGGRILLMFVASAYGGVLIGEGRMDLANFSRVVGTALRFAVVPWMLRRPDPLVMLAAAVFGTAIVETLLIVWLAHRAAPGLRLRLVRPAIAELSSLYGFGLKAFLLLISAKIISYSDTTVVGVVLGPSSVAAYSLGLQLVEYGRITLNSAIGALLPEVSGLAATSRRTELGEHYLRSVKWGGIAAGLAFVNIACWGRSVLAVWIGPSYADQARLVIVVLAVANLVQTVGAQVQIPYYVSLKEMRIPGVSLSLEALCNLTLSVVLGYSWGILGVAIGTLLPSLFISSIFVPAGLSRRLALPKWSYLRALIPGCSAALAGFLWWLTLGRAIAGYGTIWALGGAIVSCVAVGSLVAAAWLSPDERQWLLKPAYCRGK